MSRSLKLITDKVVDATQRMSLPEWNWGEGVALYGLISVGKYGGNEKVINFLRRWFEERLGADGVYETINATAPCFTLIELYDKFKDKRYETMIRSRVDFLLHRALRLGNGAFEHTLIETKFGGQMWVDTLFMAGLFLVRAGLLFHIPEAVDEGIRQYQIHIDKLQQSDGLLFHGWDEGKNKTIGCLWARGNAWASVVMVDLLAMLPEDYEIREQIKNALHLQLGGLRQTQDPSGLWTTVLNAPETYLETSAAAGISYAVAKGIRMGCVDCGYAPMAAAAMRSVLSNVDWNGELRGVSSGTGVQSHPGEYHVIARDRMESYGQGLLLMMLSEAEYFLK